MLQVKNILNDLVDYTYHDNPKKEDYKKFYIEVSNDIRKGFHGDYNGKNHHIRIFNMYRDDASIIVTTIHELAHHVDHCNRGTSSHGKEFYVEFEQLLKMGLNMGLFSKEQFFEAIADASDSNKVRKILENYEPEPVSYKSDMSIIRVKNCFDIKEQLKERGYHYNSVEKAWELETSDTETEKAFLASASSDIEYEISNNFLSFQKKIYVCAGTGSFDIKDELKADGFFFSKNDKVWKKEGTQNDVIAYMQKYPQVKWELK